MRGNKMRSVRRPRRCAGLSVLDRANLHGEALKLCRWTAPICSSCLTPGARNHGDGGQNN